MIKTIQSTNLLGIICMICILFSVSASMATIFCTHNVTSSPLGPYPAHESAFGKFNHARLITADQTSGTCNDSACRCTDNSKNPGNPEYYDQ